MLDRETICSGCCVCRDCGTEYDGHAIFSDEPERYVVQDLNCRTRIFPTDTNSHEAAAMAACREWDKHDEVIQLDHEVEVAGPGGAVRRFDVVPTWPVVYRAKIQEG